MSDSQKPKILSSLEKQFTVLPNEVEPIDSMSKAMAAALKAKNDAKKIRKPR